MGRCDSLTISLMGGDPVSTGFNCILQLFSVEALNVLIIHSLALEGSSLLSSSHTRCICSSSIMGVSSRSGQLQVRAPCSL